MSTIVSLIPISAALLLYTAKDEGKSPPKEEERLHQEKVGGSWSNYQSKTAPHFAQKTDDEDDDGPIKKGSSKFLMRGGLVFGCRRPETKWGTRGYQSQEKKKGKKRSVPCSATSILFSSCSLVHGRSESGYRLSSLDMISVVCTFIYRHRKKVANSPGLGGILCVAQKMKENQPALYASTVADAATAVFFYSVPCEFFSSCFTRKRPKKKIVQ